MGPEMVIAIVYLGKASPVLPADKKYPAGPVAGKLPVPTDEQ